MCWGRGLVQSLLPMRLVRVACGHARRQGKSHNPLVLFAAGRLAGAHPDRAALVARASKALTKALATKPFWTKL